MRMTRSSLFLLCAALVLAPACDVGASAPSEEGLPVTQPERVGLSGERLGRIQEKMRTYIDSGKIPGAITAVARDGRVAHFEVQGQMDVEAGRKMRPDTIFRIYSMTKPVTGVAVLILYEEGRFLLTDPVANYLPEFTDATVYVGGSAKRPRTEPARPLTIRHLLTHTSGLLYGGESDDGVAEMYKRAEVWKADSLEEFVKRLAAQPLAAQPGTQWHYSVSLDVLGRLVEVVSGHPFDRFLKERIFDPLGMTDTGFFVPRGNLDRLAASYGPDGDGGMKLLDAPGESSYLDPEKIPYGGHGLVSTAADYLRFAQMLANSGELDGVRILGRKTVDLMMSNHLAPELGPAPLGEAADWYQSDPRGLGFGLSGAVVTDVGRGGLSGTAGSFFWGGNATTYFWVDREERLVGLLLTQLSPSDTYPLRGAMRALTYQALID